MVGHGGKEYHGTCLETNRIHTPPAAGRCEWAFKEQYETGTDKLRGKPIRCGSAGRLALSPLYQKKGVPTHMAFHFVAYYQKHNFCSISEYSTSTHGFRLLSGRTSNCRLLKQAEVKIQSSAHRHTCAHCATNGRVKMHASTA